jgi:hypothetical protein
MADLLNLLSGFMKGRSNSIRADRELEQLKEQTRAKVSSEKVALEKEKRALLQDQQKQKLMDMLLQNIQATQGEHGQVPQDETTPMGSSFPKPEGPSLLDDLSRGQIEKELPSLPPMNQMINNQQTAQPGAGPLSGMSPMTMALAQEATGIPFVSAGGLEQRQMAEKRLEAQGNQRLAQSKDQFNITRDEKNKEINYLPQKQPDGSTIMVGFNRFGKPPGESFIGSGPPVVLKTVDMPDGGEGVQGFNEKTGQPVTKPVPTKHPPMPAAETASKVTLAMEAQKMMPKIKGIIWKDGKYNKDAVYQASLPFGGVGEGRELKSMFMDALDARIRAATGAAVTKEEWPAYFRMYLPQILDSEKLAKDKIKRLENFMESYLETLDPNSIIRDRVSATKQTVEPRKPGESISDYLKRTQK